MPAPTVVAQSRTIPVSVDYAYEKTLPLPLPTLFRHWYGPLPPIKSIRDEPPSWDTVGQTRTIVLTGTGTLRATTHQSSTRRAATTTGSPASPDRSPRSWR